MAYYITDTICKTKARETAETFVGAFWVGDQAVRTNGNVCPRCFHRDPGNVVALSVDETPDTCDRLIKRTVVGRGQGPQARTRGV